MRTRAVVCVATVLAGGALAGCGVSQGAVSLHPVNCGSTAKQAAVRCFDAALRNCRAASVTQITMAVDTGTRDVFTIVPGTSPCRITEQSQPYVVTGGIHHGPVTTTNCRVAFLAPRDVVLTCGSREVPLPSPRDGICQPRTGVLCAIRKGETG